MPNAPSITPGRPGMWRTPFEAKVHAWKEYIGPASGVPSSVRSLQARYCVSVVTVRPCRTLRNRAPRSSCKMPLLATRPGAKAFSLRVATPSPAPLRS